ncbi:MAG TPA: hypothetical protein VJN69_07875 [Candidatus Acidoferrales bacterium]|nr:hypothetical protein [Candidatus Acidoferrales bacterium]
MSAGVAAQAESPLSNGETLNLSAAPAEWQGALRELSSQILKLLPPASKVSILVKNISSLPPDDLEALESALKAQLAVAGARLVTATGADTTIQLTVSQGVEGYVAVAEVTSNGNEQVAVVTLPHVAKNASQTDGVLLDAKLIWQQPAQILDFALPAAPGFSQNILAVLEQKRLVFYSRDLTPQWQPVRALESQSSVATRDWRGHIEVSQGDSSADARWLGNECKGDFLRPTSVACAASDHRDDAWISDDSSAPFVPASGGDAVSIALQCRFQPVALVTGGGDWTQPDFVQAYELRTSGSDAPAPSGSPINFGGPVMAIWPSGAPGIARAVVRNLQTGNYEAYVITATCSQ